MTDKDLQPIPPIELEAEVIPEPDVLFSIDFELISRPKPKQIEKPQG